MPTSESEKEPTQYASIVTVSTPDASRIIDPFHRQQIPSTSNVNSDSTRPAGPSRQTSIAQSCSKFLGLDEENEEEKIRWYKKRNRFLSRRYELSVSMDKSQASTPINNKLATTSLPLDTGTSITSQVSFTEIPSIFETKKESALSLVWEYGKSIVKKGGAPKHRRIPLAARSSFDNNDIAEMTAFETPSTIVEESVEDTDRELEEDSGAQRSVPPAVSFSGGKVSFSPFPRAARSFKVLDSDIPPDPLSQPDETTKMLIRGPIDVRRPTSLKAGSVSIDTSRVSRAQQFAANRTVSCVDENFFDDLSGFKTFHDDEVLNRGPGKVFPQPIPEETKIPDRPVVFTDQPLPPSDQGIDRETLMDKIMNKMEDSSRRTRGVSALYKCPFFSEVALNKKAIAELHPALRKALEDGEDERPFFTYWVTTTQIAVCILTILFYGFAPIGLVDNKQDIRETNNLYRRIQYTDPGNLMLGPSFGDLIQLGAKFAPCMRRDPQIYSVIEEDRRKENQSGCCVLTDETACYQSGRHECPDKGARWIKWTNHTTYRGHKTSRSAGAVCGQDPDFCQSPSSIAPNIWPDDLTKWPICYSTRPAHHMLHMSCQITGRPCCNVPYGRCRIATKEYCDYINGYYHANATLCSQVDCMGDICGMIPFVTKDHPDQLYRFVFSLFLPAGLLPLVFTVLFQLYYMRDMEKMIGWVRMTILYMGSGIGGNIASALFVPYSYETGPSGSCMGVLAALIVDLVHHRNVLVNGNRVMMQFAGWFVIVFLVSAVVPFLDNWAHLFGFIFGLLITIVIFPYMDFGKEGEEKKKWKRKRIMVIIIAFITCFLLYAFLLYCFYFNKDISFPFMEYFNCAPFMSIMGPVCENKRNKIFNLLPQ